MFVFCWWWNHIFFVTVTSGLQWFCSSRSFCCQSCGSGSNGPSTLNCFPALCILSIYVEKKNQKHSQTGTLINRSIRNNYFITVLYKLWEKNLLFKINTKKINEIFFSKAFYFKDCYWYYRHWPMPFMGHVLLLQSEATQTQRGVGNGNMYWSLPCFCLAVLWHGKVQQSNHICSSLQQQ